ncbi:MAG: hypothetical protein MR283_08525 [Erysipelotrichaceae bacterium]|nr:hypothetical protein [Erysipelotrichaceae bacterium]MDY6034944.1 hypothetical protein [Bulleidia sp.]
MDQLLLDLQIVCQQLLPIIGSIVLIFLCILLRKLWETIDVVKNTIEGLDPTIRLVDKSIEKVQAPLDTVAKYSKTLDKVHDKTSAVLGKATDFANDKLDAIKKTVSPEEILQEVKSEENTVEKEG